MNNPKMRVGDFEVVYRDGVFSCCGTHVYEHADEPAFAGMVIECDECGQTMILDKCKDGVLRWMAC
jgi:hypothetical protein